MGLEEETKMVDMKSFHGRLAKDFDDMSKFVNYSKRDVALPPGCKDLSDVLRRQKVEVKTYHGTQCHGETTVGAIKDIKTFVEQLVSCLEPPAGLLISLPDGPVHFNIGLSRFTEDGSLWVSAEVKEGSDEEIGLLRFLEERGFDAPQSHSVPKAFSADVPLTVFCGVEPFPMDSATASQLLADLLREVCRLSEESELHIDYHGTVLRK
jgi:hypothetical protein